MDSALTMVPRSLSHGTGTVARHPCIRDTNMRDIGGWSLTRDGRTLQVQVDGRFLVNSARAARDLAIRGESIDFCPDCIVGSDLAEGRLIRALPDARAPALDIHAVHLRTRQVAWRARALLDFHAVDRSGGAIPDPAHP